MMNNLISVIVPVYNAEKFLSKCINSILSQTYQNFELILVNDGSTDSSGQMCNAFANKDNRIQVIHQNNSGPSIARNTGLSNSKGKYICFVDSDDWIEIDYLYQFHSILKSNQVDIIIFGYGYQYSKGGKQKKYSLPTKFANKRKEISSLLPQLEKNELISTVWSKLYLREIIEKNKIEFNSNLPYWEDTVFGWDYLYFVESIAVTDYSGYNYFQKQTVTPYTRMYHYEVTELCAKKMFDSKNKVAGKFMLTTNREFIKRLNLVNMAVMLSANCSMYVPGLEKEKSFRLKKWKEYAENQYFSIKPNESLWVKLVKGLLKLKQYKIADFVMIIRRELLSFKFK